MTFISQQFTSGRLCFLLVCASGIVLSACSTMDERFSALGPAYPPRPRDCTIEIYQAGAPSKPFIRISRLDVHVEKSVFAVPYGSPSLDDALRKLKKQACLSGAEAIIDIQERRAGLILTQIYHVEATGIRYGE